MTYDEGFAAGMRRAAQILNERAANFPVGHEQPTRGASSYNWFRHCADAILAAIPAPAPWTPPDDRADGFECLGWRREGEWEPVKWLAYMDRWWWIFTDNATGQPTAFAPLPPVPESQP